jgi:hypothetical protein
MKIAALAPLAFLALLPACSGGDEPPPPVEGNLEAPATTEANIAELPAEAPRTTLVDNTGSEGQPETQIEAVAPEEQTQADADATGMTARVDRNADTGNSTADVAQ